ncbi:hypothetical protein [Nonomuraea indica]|uniref:hypothetical protein n=1 Tax=Nonomuraea indica TaxID=1581193 RepID=UPI000C7C4ED6|nr:hypothetical protein [Nonomuraea indica]
MTVVATVVLLLNDHLLKHTHPGVVTGKLSDVAGLVVAPPLVALLLAGRADLVATLATGALFTLVKTTETGAQTASHLWTLVAGPSRVLADPTDLLALPALVLAWWIRHRTLGRGPRPHLTTGRRRTATARWRPATLWRPATALLRTAAERPRATAERWRVVAGVPLAVVAVTATAAQSAPSAAVAVRVEGERVVVLTDLVLADGEVQGLVSADGGRTWRPEAVAAPGGGPAVQPWRTRPAEALSAACVPYQARRCYRVVPGRPAVEQSDDGGVTWHPSWTLPQGRVDVLVRTYPAADRASVRARGLVVQPRPGGHVVVAAGGAAGIAVREVSGTWRLTGWPVEQAAPLRADPVEGEREVAYVFALAVLLGALGSGMRRLTTPYAVFAMLGCAGVYVTALHGFTDRSLLGVGNPVALVLGGAATLLGVTACLSLAAAARAPGRTLLVGVAGAPAAFAAAYAPFHGWVLGAPDSYGGAVALAVCLSVAVLAAVVALVRRQAAHEEHPTDYFGGSRTSRPT